MLRARKFHSRERKSTTSDGPPYLPGLIDGHVHLTDAAGSIQHQMMVALHSATESLKAGYTTQVVQGSHGGGYADVELKKAIEQGLVQSPRLLPREDGARQHAISIRVQTIRSGDRRRRRKCLALASANWHTTAHDSFSVLNQPNVAPPALAANQGGGPLEISSSVRQPAPGFGLITSTPTPARQIQLALRVIW